jgi:DNA primase
VNEDLDPRSYTMDAVLDRLDRQGDLYKDVLKTRPPLRLVS